MRLTAREIAAATGGFYFTFCGAENFTTAERLFHVLHTQNISLIYSESRQRFLFCLFGTHEWDSKDERHRATVRWTVVTASDQAPAGARIEPRCLHHEKSTSSEVLFSMKRTLRCMKSEAGLRRTERYGRFASCERSECFTETVRFPLHVCQRQTLHYRLFCYCA